MSRLTMGTRGQGVTRNVDIRLRVTVAEKTLIQERARAAGLSVSAWLRQQMGLGPTNEQSVERRKRW